MKNKQNTKKINIPKRGWQQDIAKQVGCTPRTVQNAIHKGANGKKADMCRDLYIKLYL